MANLIITIISIALVAVAALMGAYYGGAAFMNSQTVALSNALINQAKQVEAAWKVWSLNNGGQIVPTDTNWTSSGGGSSCDDFVPTYLTEFPRPPQSVNMNLGWRYWDTVPSRYYVIITLVNTNLGAEVCKKVAEIGGSPVATYVGTINTTGKVPTAQFGCTYNDTDASGAPSAGDAMWFVYRVF